MLAARRWEGVVGGVPGTYLPYVRTLMAVGQRLNVYTSITPVEYVNILASRNSSSESIEGSRVED
jgi:hypothetical protein